MTLQKRERIFMGSDIMLLTIKSHYQKSKSFLCCSPSKRKMKKIYNLILNLIVQEGLESWEKMIYQLLRSSYFIDHSNKHVHPFRIAHFEHPFTHYCNNAWACVKCQSNNDVELDWEFQFSCNYFKSNANFTNLIASNFEE